MLALPAAPQTLHCSAYRLRSPRDSPYLHLTQFNCVSLIPKLTGRIHFPKLEWLSCEWKQSKTKQTEIHCPFQVRTEEGCHPVIVRRPEARDLFWLPHGEILKRFINESILLNEPFRFASTNYLDLHAYELQSLGLISFIPGLPVMFCCLTLY